MRTTAAVRAALAGALLGICADPALAATIRVNSFLQDDADSSKCTLTNAIRAAESDAAVAGCAAGAGPDVIEIPAGTYTIAVPAETDFDGNSTAFPPITTPITLKKGVGLGPVIIERHPGAFFKFRLFYVRAATLTLEHIELRGGDVLPNYQGGAIFTEDRPVILRHVRFSNNRAVHGGAMADLGFFGTQGAHYTIENSEFEGNVASHGGGAVKVSNGGALHVRESRFVGNEAGAWGGAIYTPDGVLPAVTIVQSTFLHNRSVQTGGALHLTSPALDHVLFQENTAGDGGGALYSYGGRPLVRESNFVANAANRGGAIEVHGGSIEIDGTTLSGNSATWDGGALYLDDRPGTSRLANSTFSGNQTAGRGGGVYVYGGGLDVTNATITGNVSAHGAGLALGWWGGSTVRIANSIVSGNHDPSGAALDVQADPTEQLISLGYNVIGTDAGTRGAFTQSGDQVGTAGSPLDAGLVALADNGGPTPTHALAPFSPALDAGSTLLAGAAGACEPVDQRSMVRPGPGSSACDVGAYEHGIYHALLLTIEGTGAVTGFPGTPSCTSECAAELGVGTVVTLTAQPPAGFVLLNWAGSCTGNDLTCVIALDGERSVTATFAAAGGETVTTLRSSPNPSDLDQAVTFTAVVSPKPPALGVPTGTVTFLETTTVTVLGTVLLDADGIASVSTSALPQGQRTIQALYQGDALFGTSTASVSQRVGVLANVAPSFAMPALAEPVLEDSGVQLVAGFASVIVAGPPTESGQSLIAFSVTPINTIGDLTFVSAPVLALDGTLTYAVAPNTHGYGTFRVTLQDDGGADAGGRDTSDPQDFTITVTPVNDAPTFTLSGTAPPSSEDGGLQTVDGFAAVTNYGPANESGQTAAAYLVTQTSGILTFAAPPAIDPATGALTYTAAANANGTATFSARLRDDGGVANGGVDESNPATFLVTVTPVNDAPAITAPPDQAGTDQADVSLVVIANDLEDDKITWRASGLPPGLVIDASTGRISGNPDAVTGVVHFGVIVTAADAHGEEASISFTWTVTHEIPAPFDLILEEHVGVDEALVPIGGPVAMSLAINEGIGVDDTVTPAAGPSVASLDVLESVGVADDFVPILENTSVGNNVLVRPAGGVSIRFDSVTEGGTTTATPLIGPEPPAGLEHTDPPASYDISSTATFAGSLEVCLAYPTTAINPRLMHFEQGRWVDRTTSASPTVREVCGAVSHLSPFAVFVPQPLEGRMHGNGAVDGPGQPRFAFRAVERDIGDERGRVEISVTAPKVRQQKGRTDQFRSTRIETMRFDDHPAFRPGAGRPPAADSLAMSGSGEWNGIAGYTFELRADDRGEPGVGRDGFRITIRDDSGVDVLTLEGVLTRGNIQSQRLGRR